MPGGHRRQRVSKGGLTQQEALQRTKETIARSLPPEAIDIRYKDINFGLWAEAWNSRVLRLQPLSKQIAKANAFRADVVEWMRSYELRNPGNEALGLAVGISHWKNVRVLIPLQCRLFVEQIFWEVGPPWRNLVSGFKPVG